MSKDGNEKTTPKPANLSSVTTARGLMESSALKASTFGMDIQKSLGLSGLSSVAAMRGLTENSALKASMIGMDIQKSLGLSGLSSIAALRGLTESSAFKASILGMDIQKSLGLSGLSSVAAARGLTESMALKVSLGGMDIQKNIGLPRLAAMAVTSGLAGNPALRLSSLGIDIEKNKGMFGLATKAAAMGLTDTFALKASMLGMDIQKNLGIAGLASKVAAMGLTENPVLKATTFGVNFQNNREMFGLASKVIVAGLPYRAFIGNNPKVKDLLASPEVEKAFSHLIDEDDFEMTAKQMYLDSATVPDGSVEILPFNPNKSFMEWYDKLNPISKHAITAVFAILLSIIANLLTPFVENLIHTQKKETKAIIKTIKNGNHESNAIDKQYRFVSATRLHVREKPKTDSAIIATATLGKVVSVDYKKQGWAKISYLDENEDVVTGWVLLRYVSIFKR